MLQLFHLYKILVMIIDNIINNVTQQSIKIFDIKAKKSNRNTSTASIIYCHTNIHVDNHNGL